MPARTTPVPARFTLCDEVLATARAGALRAGLPPDAAEDCALAFVGRVLLDETESALRPPGLRHLTGTLHAPWAARAAFNHARDFLRRARRIADRELPWPDPPADGGVPFDPPDPAPGAPSLLLRRSAAEVLAAGVAGLDPGPRALLLGHHVEGRSAPDLAADTCGTAPAVEQRLLRARRRLRARLERQDWNCADLLRSLSPPPVVDPIFGTGGPPSDRDQGGPMDGPS